MHRWRLQGRCGESGEAYAFMPPRSLKGRKDGNQRRDTYSTPCDARWQSRWMSISRLCIRWWRGRLSLRRHWEFTMFVGSAKNQDLHRTLVDYGEFHYNSSFQSHAYHAFPAWRDFRHAVKQVWPKTFTIMFHISVKMLHRCEIVTHNHSQYVIPGDIST